MNKSKFIFLLIASLVAVHMQSHAQQKKLQKLAEMLAGSYTSEKQHNRDTTNYFDIRLSISRIWNSRTDGYWFYVEQAVASYYDKPYRQRVYHLTQREDGSFESAVFTMNAPLRFVHRPDLCETTLSVDSLISREGCSVILKQTARNRFEGSTEGKSCPSDRQGATYATSEVALTKNKLISWDRGYDKNDIQVWGATEGGYEFVRQH